MLGEDGEIVEDEDNPMPEDELPVIAKRVGHINEEVGMAKVGELITSATGATNGGIDILNTLKQSKLVKGEHLLHSLRKLSHCPKKQKMWLKQGRPWL